MESVAKILDDLGLEGKPKMLVFNKTDRLSADEHAALRVRYGEAVLVSARSTNTFGPLMRAIEGRIWQENLDEVHR
jgi:GTP-binding protein HflX